MATVREKIEGIEKIVKLREETGVPYAYIGDLIGLPHNGLSGYVAGRHLPEAPRWAKIIKFLAEYDGQALQRAYTGTPKNGTPLAESLRELFRKYPRISIIKWAELLDITRATLFKIKFDSQNKCNPQIGTREKIIKFLASPQNSDEFLSEINESRHKQLVEQATHARGIRLSRMESNNKESVPKGEVRVMLRSNSDWANLVRERFDSDQKTLKFRVNDRVYLDWIITSVSDSYFVVTKDADTLAIRYDSVDIIHVESPKAEVQNAA